MGLSNRDYYRDDNNARGQSDWLPDTPTVRAVLIITVVVYLLQLLVTRPVAGPGLDMGMRQALLTVWFGLDPVDVFQGQIWRLVTYAFLHDRADLWHLLMNMLVIWWLGSTLERMYGSREFLYFYLTAAFFGGLGHLAWGMSWGIPSRVVGASGVAMAVMMLYAIHFPRQQVWLMGLIPVEMRWLVAFYVLADLQPVLLAVSGEASMSGIAHVVHLGGLLYGWLYHHFRIRWDDAADTLSAGIRRLLRPRTLKIYRPEPVTTDLESEVDRILAKIHEQGTQSLTAREQATLAKASEVYKNRS